MQRISPKGIWDYDVRRIDLSDPYVRTWYVQRKIDVADWEGLNRRLLREALPKVKIDPHLRDLLQEFLSERGRRSHPYAQARRRSPRPR